MLGIFGCFVLWSCSGAGDETDAESEQVQVPLTVKILALDDEVNSGLIQELGKSYSAENKNITVTPEIVNVDGRSGTKGTLLENADIVISLSDEHPSPSTNG